MRGLQAFVGVMAALLCGQVGYAGGEAATSDSASGGRAASVETADVSLSMAKLAQLEQELGNGGDHHEASPITAGWDKKKGFFVRSVDSDDFLLRIGGRAQLRYTYKGRDKRGSNVDAGEVGERDQSFFELERVRFQFRGHVFDPRLEYQFQFDGDTDRGGGVTTLDAYARYAAMDDIVKLGLGQWKPHFTRQEKTSSGKQQFVDRSLATEFFNIDRALGAWMEGELGLDENPNLILYSFAVTNGFRSPNRGATSDQIPAFVAKLDFNLLGDYGYEESDISGDDTPDFVVGASFASDQNNGTGGTGAPNYKVYQLGTDLGFKFAGFSLQGEYMMRWLDYEATAGAGDLDVLFGRNVFSHGFYVQGGLFVVPQHVELVGRASVVYGNEGANDGTGVEAGPGLNWFINGHKLKWQTDVIFFDIPADMPRQTTNLERSGPAAAPSFSSSATNLAEGEQGVMLRTQVQLVF